MKIRDQGDTESNNLFTYRGLLETLLSYEEEVMKTRLQCEAYDEDPALEDRNPAVTSQIRGSRHGRSNSTKRRLHD